MKTLTTEQRLMVHGGEKDCHCYGSLYTGEVLYLVANVIGFVLSVTSLYWKKKHEDTKRLESAVGLAGFAVSIGLGLGGSIRTLYRKKAKSECSD